jgi:hypothetical protein
MAKGDHIYVQRTLPVPFQHHGIDCGDGTVIHYTGEIGSKQDADVRRTSIMIFSDATEVKIKVYAAAHPPEDVVVRAESRLGEKSYHILWNNCEHFARWCKTGDQESEQASDATTGGAGSVGAAVAAKAGLAAVAAVGTAGGLSGAAGTMSGLATAGALVGGGAVAGIAMVGAAPATVAVVAMQVVLRDDEKLSDEERQARKLGRVASVGGVAAGTAGAIGAVSAAGSVAGLSAAGITSGLAAIGGTLGGGMAAGLVITTAAPAVVAVAVGYGVYRLAKWFREKGTDKPQSQAPGPN